MHLIDVFYHLIYLFDATLDFAVYRGYLQSYSFQPRFLYRLAGLGTTASKAISRFTKFKNSARKLKNAKESNRLRPAQCRKLTKTEIEADTEASSSGFEGESGNDGFLTAEEDEAVEEAISHHQLTMLRYVRSRNVFDSFNL